MRVQTQTDSCGHGVQTYTPAASDLRRTGVNDHGKRFRQCEQVRQPINEYHSRVKTLTVTVCRRLHTETDLVYIGNFKIVRETGTVELHYGTVLGDEF